MRSASQEHLESQEGVRTDRKPKIKATSQGVCDDTQARRHAAYCLFFVRTGIFYHTRKERWVEVNRTVPQIADGAAGRCEAHSHSGMHVLAHMRLELAEGRSRNDTWTIIGPDRNDRRAPACQKGGLVCKRRSVARDAVAT